MYSLRRIEGWYDGRPVASRLTPPNPSSARSRPSTRTSMTRTGFVLADPVFHAFRKQRALPTIRTINEALHPSPPQIVRESYRANHIKRSVFTRPGSEADISGRLAEVCCNLKNGHPQDVPRCPFRATKRHHAPSECQGHSNVASRY